MPFVKLAAGGWKRWSNLTDIMNADHTQPTGGAFFAVNMLVVTTGGRTYSYEEIKSSLESIGYINVNLIQPDERMTGLVEGFKP